MRTLAPEALAAIVAGEARIGGAVEILASDEPIRIWSGHGDLPLDGETYHGISHRDLGIAGGASLGGIAQNLTLTLSGIEPELLGLLEPDTVKSAPVRIHTLIFDSTHTQLLDSYVIRRGRIDRVIVKEESGGTASISVEVEGPGRGLGRKTGRIRADADQRLIEPNDGGLREVSFAAEKTLYWGGRRPSRAGESLGGQVWRGWTGDRKLLN